jgi:diguanylate cyclase (GGDEF)-like protein/PAS domain S-box-containing protein
VSAVDGTLALPLTIANPAVGRFSRRWAAALAESGRVTGEGADLAAELAPLTLRIAHVVRDGADDPDVGFDVGLALMRHGHGTTTVLAPTITTLADSLADELAPTLPPEPDGRPGRVPRERVTAVAATVAEGFARAAREHALAAQEELQRAALTAVRKAEGQRRTSEARFAALFAQAAVAIGIISTQGRVIDGNAAWGRQMGLTVEEMIGRTIAEIVMPGGSQLALVLFKELLTGARDSFRLEIQHVNHEGRKLFLDLSVSRVRTAGDEPDFLVGVSVDVTDRKRLEDQLWHESRHDPLTGLPNRTLFFERLGDALAGPSDRLPVGVCYIDLDGFKSINDGLGHDVGDRVLARVGDRLRGAVTETGTLLARLGGDEFGILLDGDFPVTPDEQARRVLEALAEPITIDGRELTVSASVGVVDSVTAGTEPDWLMRAADISLYRAKSRGRGRWERHDPDEGAQHVTSHTLATEMKAALTRGEFALEYQPLVSLDDGRVRRVEALLRWRHPRLGVLYPDRFIGMAEQNGTIVALGRWVVDAACRAAYEWHQAFPQAGIGVNVNVAVGQLYDPGMHEHLLTTLAATGLPPHLLYLELTESAVLGEASGPVDALAGIAAAGVRLVIDDFGTGYSNLLHLARLPASELKIAGSFLAPSIGDPENDKILPAIISLGHSLGLTVTAEGVETGAQADRLRAMGCDTAQGWHFGPPTSAAEIAARIAKDHQDHHQTPR